MSNQGPLDFKPPSVNGVEDPDLDPDGYIPLDLLLAGIEVVVPLWPSHATGPDDRDLLTVYFDQPGQPLIKIENIYKAADIKPQFVIPINASHLQVNGQGKLWYELLDTADHRSKSEPRTLTIDHAPVPMTLTPPGFLYLNLNGYLNCFTQPPIWDGIFVTVPPLTGFNPGDRLELQWRGYSSLNGSGAEYVRARKKIVKPALSDEDIRQGFKVIVAPYDVHIKPMAKNSSAVVRYRILRGRRLVGVSKIGVAKIDRKLPGHDLLCGP
ncbi:hypothetical protein [Pseudomonas fluorescens]|uniref:hypothetical protein n=1 Tax=Pseudomonas fluorescens TaxID=294 RepID=UPI00058A7A15|nr:hypothetical protein [Pseudomonas fluorescens]CEL29491.1 hypothetical protein SRM1_02842 [Pseudomonas fluorescens]